MAPMTRSPHVPAMGHPKSHHVNGALATIAATKAVARDDSDARPGFALLCSWACRADKLSSCKRRSAIVCPRGCRRQLVKRRSRSLLSSSRRDTSNRRVEEQIDTCNNPPPTSPLGIASRGESGAQSRQEASTERAPACGRSRPLGSCAHRCRQRTHTLDLATHAGCRAHTFWGRA